MKSFNEKLRNVDLVKLMLGIAGLGIFVCAVVLFFTSDFADQPIITRTPEPGHIICYSVNGTMVLDVYSPDVIWHNTSGVTFKDREGRTVTFSNENCMVTSDQRP